MKIGLTFQNPKQQTNTSFKMLRTSLLLLVLLFGPYSITTALAEQEINDPFEGVNRVIFDFNESFDEHLLLPATEAWRTTPDPIQIAVRNFFNNLDDITHSLNALLQFKFEQSLSDASRFVTNSTFGLLGLFDVATHWGMPQHNETFADTLGYWGVDSGPYIVLPFLGPSSVRDGLSRFVDLQTDPIYYYNPSLHQYAFRGLEAIDLRSKLINADKLSSDLALDPYSFMRDSYHQFRQNRIYDGNPPEELFDESSIENLE